MIELDHESGLLTVEQFTQLYLDPNEPVVIRSSYSKNDCCDWEAYQKWNQQKQSLLFLQDLAESGTVASCVDEATGDCIDISLKDFIDYWTSHQTTEEASQSARLYLKDFHLASHIGCDFYTVPEYFARDYLNSYLESCPSKTNDDYKFVYIGVSGTSTPLHTDVFGSFSWSANVFGVKTWRFYRPVVDSLLSIDVDGCHQKIWSHEAIVVNQYPGDIIFVPSLWRHDVVNQGPTCSINHNWFNCSNLKFVTSELLNAMYEGQASIREDCRSHDCDSTDPDVRLVALREWEFMSENLLKGHFGMNMHSYHALLEFVVHHQSTTMKELIEVGRIITDVILVHCSELPNVEVKFYALSQEVSARTKCITK
eukprot:GHVH01000086.1.p1 GENE.GHVH01000086.1~~GHVH01000086.1.p1  ORF type:complete len:380 (+),score=41.97 GHVH01000086.1:39-1142(+)